MTDKEYIVVLELRLSLSDPFSTNADAGYFAHTAASRSEGMTANGCTIVSVERAPIANVGQLDGAPLDEPLHIH